MKKIPFFHQMISTGFFVGYFPYGPGTMGALLAIVIWYILSLFTTFSTLFLLLIGLIILFTILGIWSGGVSEKYWGEDPHRVVVDEMVGQWINLLAVPATLDWKYILVAFILFRFFDILKPLGIRKMESLGGGTGIMADDILSGIYGAIVLYLAIYLGF